MECQDEYFGLRGKVVLITGASSGIGAETAVEFAKRGSRLMLTGRDAQRLDDTVDKCVKTGLPRDQIHTCTGDILKEEDIKNIVDSAMGKFGTVQILVNNASFLGEAVTTMPQASRATMQEQFNIQVLAPMTFIQLLLPQLIKNKGAVINVSSVCGSIGTNEVGPYSACKAAQDHMTRMFTLDLGKEGVRFCSVSPGLVLTPMMKALGLHPDLGPESKKLVDQRSQTYPLKRLAEARDISGTIVFLASAAASYITGVNLYVAGGYQITIA